MTVPSKRTALFKILRPAVKAHKLPTKMNGSTPVKIQLNEQIAQELLTGGFNDHNRVLSPQSVATLSSEMRVVGVIDTGVPFVFGSDGRLLDGQHRLKSFHEMDVYPEVWAMVDADPAAFRVLDTHKPRDLKTLLQLKGYKRAGDLANAINQTLALRNHGKGELQNVDAAKAGNQPHRVETFESEFPELVNSLALVDAEGDTSFASRQHFRAPGLCAAVHYFTDAKEGFLHLLREMNGYDGKKLTKSGKIPRVAVQTLQKEREENREKSHSATRQKLMKLAVCVVAIHLILNERKTISPGAFQDAVHAYLSLKDHHLVPDLKRPDAAKL